MQSLYLYLELLRRTWSAFQQWQHPSSCCSIHEEEQEGHLRWLQAKDRSATHTHLLL